MEKEKEKPEKEKEFILSYLDSSYRIYIWKVGSDYIKEKRSNYIFNEEEINIYLD